MSREFMLGSAAMAAALGGVGLGGAAVSEPNSLFALALALSCLAFVSSIISFSVSKNLEWNDE